MLSAASGQTWYQTWYYDIVPHRRIVSSEASEVQGRRLLDLVAAVS